MNAVCTWWEHCFNASRITWRTMRRYENLHVHLVLTWQNMWWGFEEGGMERTTSAVLRSLSCQPSLLFSTPAGCHQNRQCRKDSKDLEACRWSGALKSFWHKQKTQKLFKSSLRTWKTLKDSLCTNASNHSKARPLRGQMCSTCQIVNVLWHYSTSCNSVALWYPVMPRVQAMQSHAASHSAFAQLPIPPPNVFPLHVSPPSQLPGNAHAERHTTREQVGCTWCLHISIYQHCIVLNRIESYLIVFDRSALCCTVLYCVVSCRVVSCRVVLYCTVLYCMYVSIFVSTYVCKYAGILYTYVTIV